MKRQFLTQFLDKISAFPSWVKEIIYTRLSKDVQQENNLAYTFATYKPTLTYKGKCELDFKNSNFDVNIYNMLDSCDKDCSISDISLNTFLSMEEVASYFLFCVDEGYLELPDNSQILNIAGFLAGKFRTGEYFVNDGSISETQLNSAVEDFESQNKKGKFGQKLIEMGLISQSQLDKLLSIKEEAQKRFILDHNEIPEITQTYSDDAEIYKKEIVRLKDENEKLKIKLEHLLTMVKKND